MYKRHQEKTSIVYLALSSAIADLLYGLITIPFKMTCERLGIVCSTEVWYITDSFVSVLLVVSLMNVCLMHLDRYFSIVHPFFYRGTISHRVHIIILSAWLFACVQEIPSTLGYAKIWIAGDSIDTIIKLFLLGILPPVLAIYTFIRIGIVLRRHRKAIKERRKYFHCLQKIKRQDSVNRARYIILAAVSVMMFVGVIQAIFCQYIIINYLLRIRPSKVIDEVVFTVFYVHSIPNALIIVYIGKQRNASDLQ